MQSVREVYSLLMPIRDGRLVIPRAAVAEVMGYSKPKERPEDAPDFLLGFVEWQGQKIPLVSFEAVRGQGVPELGRRTRIAVVFGIAGRLKPDVFAVVTQGYPYLVRINENVLQREEMPDEDPLILARVRMANEKPYIPDIEELEKRLAVALGIADIEPVEEPVDELDALGGSEEDFDAGFLDIESEDLDGQDSDTGPEADGEGGQNSFEVAGEDDEAAGAALDVTAFGETDYSSELGELSAALEGNDGQGETESEEEAYSIELSADGNSEEPLSDGARGDDAIDFSGLELDDESEGGEYDLSDLEIELDDDEEDKKND